jgi:hypothetical protein
MPRGRKLEGIPEMLAKTKKVGSCLIFQSHHKKHAQTTGGEGVHRKMFRLVNGPIPAGMYVCHKCDNPKCINPEHLFLGTPKDNSQDAIKKGRMTMLKLRGEQKRHKLTKAQVEEIRALSKSGVFQTSIAEQFNITQSAVSRIVSGEIRKEG